MEDKLHILTERQRDVYLLKQQKMSYKKISEVLGITPSIARSIYENAMRRLIDYEYYHAVEERNDEKTDFPLTRGELKLIREGLVLLSDSRQYSVSGNAKADRQGRKSYKRLVIDRMIDRADEVPCDRAVPKNIKTE